MTSRHLRGFDRQALVKRREARKLERGDLARLANISSKTIWTWEAGTRTPTPDALARVAKALGVSVGSFVKIPKNKRTLVDLRVLAGLTPPQLALAAGMSTTALQALERAETHLPDEKAARLAPLLAATPDEVRTAWHRARARPSGTPA